MGKGYVYFIACKDPNYRVSNPHMKIGWTTDLKGRLSAIQTGSPVELALMGYIESEDPSKLERYFHKLFIKDRKHGEWFDVTPAMITRINSYQIRDNHFPEFFLAPIEVESDKIITLRAEISQLRKVIADRDKAIRDLGLPFSRSAKSSQVGGKMHSSQFHGWPYKAQQEMNYNRRK